MSEYDKYRARWKPPDVPLSPDKRSPLHRPRISLPGVLIDCFLPPALLAGGWVGLSKLFPFTPLQFRWGLTFFLATYFLFRIKQIALWCILFYQKWAPKHIRHACCYEPSCSEYMYQSIVKYGLIAGGWNGWKRLLRCRGGFGQSDPLD